MAERVGNLVKARTGAAPSFTPVIPALVQRKCACGGSAGFSGQCADCARNPHLAPALGQLYLTPQDGAAKFASGPAP